jgi:hypothetical protein
VWLSELISQVSVGVAALLHLDDFRDGSVRAAAYGKEVSRNGAPPRVLYGLGLHGGLGKAMRLSRISSLSLPERDRRLAVLTCDVPATLATAMSLGTGTVRGSTAVVSSGCSEDEEEKLARELSVDEADRAVAPDGDRDNEPSVLMVRGAAGEMGGRRS